MRRLTLTLAAVSSLAITVPAMAAATGSTARAIDGTNLDDTMFGGHGDDTLIGGRGGDVLTGVAGKDYLAAAGVKVVVRGGSGADVIVGFSSDKGTDYYFCGRGKDVVVYDAGIDPADQLRGCETMLENGGHYRLPTT